MARFRRDIRWLGAFGALMLALAACGTPSAALPVSGSSASCARLTRAQQFKAARVVLIGVMLSGATVRVGGRIELSSPARMRVSRYLKSRGPMVVRIATAVRASGSGYSFAEDGIEPRAGQRWKIYSSSAHQPYATSICAGSRMIRPSAA